MKHSNLSKILLSFVVLLAIAVPTMAQTNTKGTAVAYPWVFKKGNVTSRTMAITTAEEIARNAGYSSIPTDIAADAWASHNFPEPTYGRLPSNATLKAFGKALKVSKVVYGSVAWHTRSIWVNAGPKTISTATVSVYVFDVASGKVVYSKKGVQGRSDERSQLVKLALDVVLSPLVTVVSGGPATPQEQRAVQIALALAYRPWVKPGSMTK